MTPLLTGVHVPLVTPFDAAGRLDRAALERIAVRCLEQGAAGLVALGTTGEPAALSAAEADAVVACCREVCAGFGAALTVGAGGGATAAAACAVAARGGEEGVSALLVVVPPYVRPAEAGVLAHFARLADASPVPLVIYEIPYRTGIRLSTAALLELAADPRIAGVKLSVGAVDEDALTLLAQAPPSFAVLAGDDALILPLAAAGAAGAIAAAAHCATARFVALLDAVGAGDLRAARGHAHALDPLVRALFAEPNPSVIKAVLHREGLLATPAVRLPHVRASVDAGERGWAALGAATWQ